MELSRIARLPNKLLTALACKDCTLHKTRRNVIIGSGSLPCEILLVGEGPGANEDLRGIPFIGPSGKMLEQGLTRALRNLHMEMPSHFITNVVMCRPVEIDETGRFHNREPEPMEIMLCRKHLIDVFNEAKPKIIITLGSVASKHCKLTSDNAVFNVVHPAFVLRKQAAQPRFLRGLMTALEAYKERYL